MLQTNKYQTPIFNEPGGEVSRTVQLGTILRYASEPSVSNPERVKWRGNYVVIGDDIFVSVMDPSGLGWEWVKEKDVTEFRATTRAAT